MRNVYRLAAKAREIENAAARPIEAFSVYGWCTQIGDIRLVDRAYAKNGSFAGYVVFWDGVTLNTDIGFVYSREEDIELSVRAIRFINDGIESEFAFKRHLFPYSLMLQGESF